MTVESAVQHKKNQLTRFSGLVLLLVPYLLYLGFIIWNNRGPIDYETFMEIGQRLLSGGRVYGVNSYYPMPFVMVFGLFSALPRPLSMALWLLLPLACVLLVSGWRPSALLFAPVFGHFVGGQTAVFGMLGLWGYRRNADPDKLSGGHLAGADPVKTATWPGAPGLRGGAVVADAAQEQAHPAPGLGLAGQYGGALPARLSHPAGLAAAVAPVTPPAFGAGHVGVHPAHAVPGTVGAAPAVLAGLGCAQFRAAGAGPASSPPSRSYYCCWVYCSL